MPKQPHPAGLGNVLYALVLAGLIPLLASTAAAQSGLYLAADVGLARGSTSDSNTEVGRGDIDFDSGLGYSLAVGLGWQGLRLEGEATWRRTDVDGLDYDRLDLGGLGDLEDRVRKLIDDNVKGNQTTVGFMANAWYDLDLGVGLAPYVGGGFGVKYVRYDIDLPVELELPTIPGLSPTASRALNEFGVGDGDWVLAYQFGLGLGYRLLDSMVLHLGYRYMGTGDPKFKWDDGSTVKSELRNHVFRAGLRIGF
ncbi:MAG: outer membrane beta-barrel protein [Deltaproteobacteria bacterium]|nr:outer membrane beta-barrel protein [Deltaproteobacteria bacterium]